MASMGMTLRWINTTHNTIGLIQEEDDEEDERFGYLTYLT